MVHFFFFLSFNSNTFYNALPDKITIKIEAKIIDSLGAKKQQMWHNNKDVLSFLKYIS